MKTKRNMKILIMLILIAVLVICTLAVYFKINAKTHIVDEPNSQENKPTQVSSITLDEQQAKISAFYTEFFLADRWTSSDSHKFCFRIDRDENGILTVYEDISSISFPADVSIIENINYILTEYNLFDMDGTYKVTPGVAPEYQKCSMAVNYDSGKKLQFTINNNPHARWAEEIYTVFADWFADKGNFTLFPEKETSLPLRIDISYTENEKTYSYRTIVSSDKLDPSDGFIIKKKIYDTSLGKNIYTGQAELPSDYFEKAGEIIHRHNIVLKYDFSHYDHFAQDYGNHHRGYYGMGERTDRNEKDSDSISFSLYVKFQSGRTIDINTSKESELSSMIPFISELMEYHNSVL